MTGRPSDFSQETADKICERIADGESLRAVCNHPEMPNKATVFRWLGDPRYANFRDQYARAMEARADSLVDDITVISDSSLEPNDKRVRVDARKWVASKLRPRKYGDRIEHTGPEGGPVQTIEQTALAKLTDEELERLTEIRRKLGLADAGAAGSGEAAAG